MNIFNIEQTAEDIKKQEIKNCAQQRRFALENFIHSYQTSFDMFWNNRKVSPQEQCDALGNKAVEFFQVSAITQNYIKALKPDWVEPTMPYEFEIKEDGTVIIGDKIVEE
jgi:hypothetical protein